MMLTPWVLTSMTLLVMMVVPVLTLAIAAWLLARYRRAVKRQMQLDSDNAAQSSAIRRSVATQMQCDADAPEQTSAIHRDVRRQTQRDSDASERACADAGNLAPACDETHRRIVPDPMMGPNRLLFRYGLAGATLATVFAVAAWFVYPHQLGIAGFLLALWIYLWPVVVAAWLVMPVDWRRRLGLLALYATVFALLIAWAHTIKDIPAIRSGTIVLPARSSATPQVLIKLWLVVSGAPTLLALLCFNRWAKPVAPLVLAFVTVLVIGVLGAYMAVYSPQGIDLTVAAAVALDVHVLWLVATLAIVAIATLSVAAWSLLRWLARASRRRTVTAQSLMLDALWLLFASFFGMWLTLGGVGWVAVAPVAFVIYKSVLAVLQRRGQSDWAGHDLTFLRVFSLGRRSERLFDRLHRYWGHLGSLQLIAGPDTARSTVQPHQFLDFVGGKLATHFVHDAESLERSAAEVERSRGIDGLFGTNTFFCRDDSWKLALPRLFGTDDKVLMDLRGFSEANAGCKHELEYLVATVSLQRCLLLVDETTDRAFLARVLEQAWAGMPADSPNRGIPPEAMPLHPFAAGAVGDRALVHRLLGSDPHNALI